MAKKDEKTAKLTKKINELSKNMIDSNIEPIGITKKKKKQKLSFKTSEVVVLVILTALISLFVGSAITIKSNTSLKNDNIQKFIDNYNQIINEYYGEIDESKLIDGAIEGLINSLDNYSAYFDEEESEVFNTRLTGEYKGVGLEIYNNQNSDIVVLTVFDDTPASKAGLKTGDIITKINDTDVAKKTATDFVAKVKEYGNNNFTLTYIRNGNEEKAELQNSQITIPSITSKMFTEDNKNIGYIDISIFANNTNTQFEKALKNLESQNMDSLIIDVRNNSGGHLSSAKSIIEMFLDSTKPIYQTETKTEKKKVYSEGKQTKQYKVIVLINGNSASASELLASALQEQLNADLVGEKTFGKGTVQELKKLKDGTQYKITTKKWLTSKGVWLDGTGLTPTIKVESSNEYLTNPSEENDNQLKAALAELKK